MFTKHLLFAAAFLALPGLAMAQEGATDEGGATGAVKRMADGICLEPGHPLYATSLEEARFPTVRACVAAGGRRDVRTDAIDPLAPVASTAPQTPTGTVPTGPGIVPGMAVPTPEAIRDMQDQGIIPEGASPEEYGVASAPVQRAQPGAPKGIEIPPVPSYSENPDLFRPPGDYIGRSADQFEP